MRACVQRVSEARVSVDGASVGEISRPTLSMLAWRQLETATIEDARMLADKIVRLRIFGDHEGKMNRSLADVNGGMLVVSQFTLLGDCRKGRRPSFVEAAPPELAEPLYLEFVAMVAAQGITVATGRFRTDMTVAARVIDGPVTLLLDTSLQL